MENNEFVTQAGLDRLDERLTSSIKGNTEAINQNREDIVGLKALYSTLVKLPETIMSLEKTVVGINHNLEALSEKIIDIKDTVVEQKKSIDDLREENRQQNKNMDRIDNKSKIDWTTAVTSNFWKIFAILAAGYVVIQQMMH